MMGKRILHPSAAAYTRYGTLNWRLSRGPDSLFWYKTPHRLPQGVLGPYQEVCQTLGDARGEQDAPAGVCFPRSSRLLDEALELKAEACNTTAGSALSISKES